jgi:hypothetical protein
MRFADLAQPLRRVDRRTIPSQSSGRCFQLQADAGFWCTKVQTQSRSKHSVRCKVFFMASTMPQRQAVDVLRRRSPLRFADIRSTQDRVKHATCWLGRSVALPIPNLPDASSDELGWMFLVCKQPLHLDKHERLMRVAKRRSRTGDSRSMLQVQHRTAFGRLRPFDIHEYRCSTHYH